MRGQVVQAIASKLIKSMQVVTGTTAVNSLGIDPNCSVAIPLALPISVTTGIGQNFRVGNLTAGGSTSGIHPQLIIEFDSSVINSKQQGSVSASGTVTINSVVPANCIVFIYGTSTNRTSSQAQFAYYTASLTGGTTLQVTETNTSYSGIKGANWVVLEFKSGVL